MNFSKAEKEEGCGFRTLLLLCQLSMFRLFDNNLLSVEDIDA